MIKIHIKIKIKIQRNMEEPNLVTLSSVYYSYLR